jgi:citrate lyase subunit beta / citryl-CoA lyase
MSYGPPVETVPRRSVLAVPGSNVRMLEKARGIAADEVFLDLEDAVAPAAKQDARGLVVDALRADGWGEQLRVVRVNAWSTEWTHRDVIAVVEGAGDRVDAFLLPKVQSAEEVVATDLLLTQLERALGLPSGGIGLEVQIESARGLVAVDAIAAASPRARALVLGPADLIADLGTRTAVVGEQPAGYESGDAYHYPLMRILVAARAAGLQAIDGPYLRVRDLDGMRRAAGRSAALGYDGVWCVHPDQVPVANELFTPRQEDYDHAELVLAAYAWHTSTAGGQRGAVMLSDEMLDEASRAMAGRVAAQGRAAGLVARESFVPPPR